MGYKYNQALVPNAQALRKNMTPEEKHLWYDFLKKLPLTVNRQKNIGNYIVDFYIAKGRIVIELDGAQHETPEHRAKDAERDCVLHELGITVLRYTNDDVHHSFYAVCNDILDHLGLIASEVRWRE